MAKYELTGDFRIVDDVPVYRIRRQADGMLGGFVQSEKNLSQTGEAWVGGDAVVMGDAVVSDNAQVYGNAHVYGRARIEHHAAVSDHSRVGGRAIITGRCQISGRSDVIDATLMRGIHVTNNACIQTPHVITGFGTIGTDAKIFHGIALEAAPGANISITNVTIPHFLVCATSIASKNDYIYLTHGNYEVIITRKGIGVRTHHSPQSAANMNYYPLDLLAEQCVLPARGADAAIQAIINASITIARQLWSSEIRYTSEAPSQARSRRRHIELRPFQ